VLLEAFSRRASTLCRNLICRATPQHDHEKCGLVGARHDEDTTLQDLIALIAFSAKTKRRPGKLGRLGIQNLLLRLGNHGLGLRQFRLV